MDFFDELHDLDDLHDYLFSDTEAPSLVVQLTKRMLIEKNNYPNLRSLDLEGQALQTFSENVFADLSILESISLNDNLIIQLPDNLFANNPKLKIITVRNNLIEELKPQVFSQLSALRVLDFCNNLIEKIEKSCLESEKLNSLNLSHNRISDLNCEAFDRLPVLLDLDLSWNCLETVRISAPILSTLNLKGNTIHFVAFNLPGLLHLQFDGNGVSSFKEIAKNCPDSICILNLDDNKIDEMARSDFKKFQRLESLTVTVNLNFDFGSLGFLNQLRKLQITYLGPFAFNQTHIFVGLHKKGLLKELKLTFANFQSVWFKMLPKINNLKLYKHCCLTPNNAFATEIDIFDDILTRMPKLTSLTLKNLNYFRLKEIPNMSGFFVNSLESLALEGLRNSTLTNLFRSFNLLVHLDLVQCWVKTISKTDFEHCYFLKSLNLSYSKLQRIEPECFCSNIRLETIDLSYCLIEYIGDNCFVTLTGLKNLNLTNNPIRNVSTLAFRGIDFNRNILQHDPELIIIINS